MNMDVYSLIMAWGLDLGESEEMVKVMESIVHRDYLNGMDSILEWEISGVGFHVREEIEMYNMSVLGNPFPLFVSQRGVSKHTAERRQNTIGKH
ncbi:hypothetical protein SUGI_0251870 [Cryptomeria japonica]|nr:hypothetical protein SUGI_0251870 [Cryptomeria japonica]